ncbi:helix-turn-helix domain-containing protein [Deinococcus sp. SM5_A1]|uniref:helix-turn-helix domain-containing protein n=1 Tax=Deinococcus sp. SM5_A1 TaxID=3379094 RepID=UPI00385CAAB8
MDKPMAGGYTARVTFRELLELRGLSAYRVATAGQGIVSRNAVYSLARGDANRVDLGTLGKLAGLLEHLTGYRVTAGDLLVLERTV